TRLVSAWICERVAPRSASASASPTLLPKMMQTSSSAMMVIRLFLFLVPSAEDAIKYDCNHDDDKTCFEAERNVDGVQPAHHRHAETVGSDKRGDDHHRQRKHDRLGQARED